MHPIFLLDRTQWSQSRTENRFYLDHATGVHLMIQTDTMRDRWFVHQIFPHKATEIVLQCAPTFISTSGDPWPVVWSTLESAIGPGTVDTFQRVYEFVHKVMVLNGTRGDVHYQRKILRDERDALVFSGRWGNTETKHGLFGGYHAQVDAAMASVARISLPDTYTGILSPGQRSWSHLGRIQWNAQCTGHARLQLLAEVQEHGLHLPD